MNRKTLTIAAVIAVGTLIGVALAGFMAPQAAEPSV
jgi:hypothetical protein